MEDSGCDVDQAGSQSASPRPRDQNLTFTHGSSSSAMPENLESHVSEIAPAPFKQPSLSSAGLPLAGEDQDDDVQFMYCAPKSKRNKRKRSEELENTGEKMVEALVDETSPGPAIKPEKEPRRASAGMIDKIGSCHIGSDEEVPIPARTGSLSEPVVTSTQISIPISVQSNPSDSPIPILSPQLPCQLPSPGPALPAVWDDPPRSPPGKQWRPIRFDGNSAKRQRHNKPTGSIVTTPISLSQLPQVSPKTVPSSLSSVFQQSSPASSYMDMLGISGVQDIRGPTLPNNTTGINYLGFDRSRQVNTDPPQNRDHYDPERTLPGSSSQGNCIWSNASRLHPQSSDTTSSQKSQSGMHASWNNFPEHIAQPPNARSSEALLSSLPRAWQQQQRQTSILPQSQQAWQSSPRETSDTHLSSHRLPKPNNPPLFWRTTRPPYMYQSRTSGRNMLDSSLTRAADILRKPSLYKIPPWPSTSNTTSSQIPTVKNSSGNGGVTDGQRPALASVPLPTGKSVAPKQSRHTDVRQHEALEAITPQSQEVHSSEIPTTQPFDPNAPPKRAGHEHSPNLIIDIAETCQRLFPFAAVAARHNKSVQKVFDTFSAIIQIPLLRNAQDNRRHGSLGKRRMREYREAKRARERANEEARRERTGRVERDGGGDGGVLLKRAVVNSARETAGGV